MAKLSIGAVRSSESSKNHDGDWLSVDAVDGSGSVDRPVGPSIVGGHCSPCSGTFGGIVP